MRVAEPAPNAPRERRGRRQSEGRERGGSELGSDASAGSGRGLGGQAPRAGRDSRPREDRADTWPLHSCPRGPPRATAAES